MQPDTGWPETLDVERHVPALLSRLASRLSATASRECRAASGLGYTDWRVMARIAASPHISAARLCLHTGLDKAAVSRSFSALAGRGLLRLETSGRDRRAALSVAGEHLHAGLLALAVQRERRLLGGFSEPEVALLRRLLCRLADNMPALETGRADAGSQADDGDRDAASAGWETTPP